MTLKKSYQELEKEKNYKKILIYLKKKRKITKLELAEKLGLSIPTVTKILNELLDQGIVFESILSESNGGRRALMFEFIPDSVLSIAVKLELDYLQLAVVNLDGLVLKKKIINKNFIKNEELINILTDEIKIFIFEVGLLAQKIKGIGISIPGIVSDESLILKVGTNFKLYNLDFEQLKNNLNYDVFIENEANAGALAEFEKIKAKKNKNILLISIGTGIGTGIVVNGTLYRGSGNRAGEAGHMTLYKHGKICNCGSSGCWELYCSNPALINEFREALPDETLSSLKDVFSKKIMSQDISQKIIDEYAKNLAIGIKNLLLIFDCDKIIISGEICNYSKYIRDTLDNILFHQDVFYSGENKKLEFSDYKADSNLVGAGLLVFKDLFIL